MLRFRPIDDEAAARHLSRSGTDTRLRCRLWMLLIALGLVIATMRQLNEPSTARRFGAIFSPVDVTSQQDFDRQFELSIDETHRPRPGRAETVERAEPPALSSDREDASDALDLVQDNTYFRPAEHAAWFELLGRLQQMQSQQVKENSLGELTYAQLLKQPEVYRGQVVTVSGTLRREGVEHAPKNELEVERYHRLVIQPRGGGHWPFVVYCLELPDELPRGDDLKSLITVHGYFFKNWSYAWQDGLGVAPVVLARSVDWQPSPPKTPPRGISIQTLAAASLVACGFAFGIVWLALHNTRRSRHPASDATVVLPEADAAETTSEQLKKLAEAGSQE